MLYKKMKEMLKAGIDPIEVSQEKWREMRKSVERSDYKRALRQNDNCALCYVNKGNCDKCVLKSCADQHCRPYFAATAYSKAANAIETKLDELASNSITKQEVLKAIDNMIDTLEDLKT